MRLLLPPIAALATLLSGSTVLAQTADQARLMFSIGLGQSSGGGRLWSVGRQPFVIDATTTDTLALERSFRRSLDVVLSGTYFPGDHLGFNVEAQLLGLATEDNCRVVAKLSPPANTDTPDLCRTIGRRTRSGTSAALSGGLIYRVGSHQPLHPYVRANAGLLVTQQSFVKTTGTVYTVDGFPAALTLYEDERPSTVKPYLSFGGGVVAVIGKGYQLRFELRDNWVRVPKVDGPTSRQGLKPPTSTVGKHLLTATIGFDVVLERKRGRRY
jgi:hypothetical protein